VRHGVWGRAAMTLAIYLATMLIVEAIVTGRTVHLMLAEINSANQAMGEAKLDPDEMTDVEQLHWYRAALRQYAAYRNRWFHWTWIIGQPHVSFPCFGCMGIMCSLSDKEYQSAR